VRSTLINMALALAVGLIVGIERGWQERDATEGSRVAGIRTFVLVSLLGGLCAIVSDGQNHLFTGIVFLSLSIVLAVARFAESRRSQDYGSTTIVAALVTFLLGALAAGGEAAIAAAGAVVVALLLNLKPALHGWLRHLELEEIRAGLKLLLLSVVILPILPNKGYGPWQALNPYKIWWIVVVIAGISFAAYIAVKVAGTERGIALTGLFGGMISSTGVTLQLSRLASTFQHPDLLAVGILIASATMFVRVLVVVAILNRPLALSLALPLLAMAAPLVVTAWIRARSASSAATRQLDLRNPLELAEALKFGGVLTAILILSKGMQHWLGSTGLYLVAGIAGLADVDAITITIAQMPAAEFSLQAATLAATLAAMVNTLTKGVLTWSTGGKAIGLKVLPPFVLAVILGGLVLVFR
jgi:uncharacterized membrane protein (DUF4010 family)